MVLSGPGTEGVQLTLEVTSTGHRMIVLTGEVFHNEEACEYQDLLHNDTLRVGASMVLYKNPDATLPEVAPTTEAATPAMQEPSAALGELDELDTLGDLDLSDDELEADQTVTATEMDWDPAGSELIEIGLLDSDDTEDIAVEESEVLTEQEGLEEVVDRAELEGEAKGAEAVAVTEAEAPAGELLGLQVSQPRGALDVEVVVRVLVQRELHVQCRVELGRRSALRAPATVDILRLGEVVERLCERQRVEARSLVGGNERVCGRRSGARAPGRTRRRMGRTRGRSR